MSLVGDALHGGAVDAAEVERVRDSLVFEGAELRMRVVRFWVLLVLATGIATFGLMGDSVATVIGAMIVAPLMIPIMGLAFAVSIGDREAILSSALIAAGGIATAILVGWLLSWPFPNASDITSNAQIMARTAPRLVDLLAAFATGLAGAFAAGRRDVSDTLPGVAIAISLVPPLANVGICLSFGRPDLAMGSMVLFVTNFLAIVLTGAVVFGVMGYPRVSHANESKGARRAALVAVVLMLVAIAVPLGVTSYGVLRDNIAQQRASDVTDEWLKGSAYSLYSIDVADDMRIVVAGHGPIPDTAALQAALKGQLFGMEVRLEIIPANEERFSTL